MLVSRQKLERRLERLRAEVPDPRAGIYGPGTMAWRLNREALNFLGGGRAALLQLAHPYVAHGVDQHSATRTDARGRFQRTFAYIFAMTFGDLEQAFRAARRVHAIHSRIVGIIDEDVGAYPRGTRYRANDAGALFWVHATLFETVVAVRDAVGMPLSAAEREQYYQETKRFAALFGIPDQEIPPDYAAFRAYWQQMIDSDRLAVGRPAREIGELLFRPPRPELAPAADWYRAVTARLLPPRLRAPFGLRYGTRERMLVAASLPALRALYRATPRPLRYLPGYLEALERVEEAGGPVRRFANRAAARAMTFWPRPA